MPESSDIGSGELLIPLGVGKKINNGTDCTIVGIAGANIHALNAAKELEKEGITVDIIDPRTLVPLDKKIILDLNLSLELIKDIIKAYGSKNGK